MISRSVNLTTLHYFSVRNAVRLNTSWRVLNISSIKMQKPLCSLWTGSSGIKRSTSQFHFATYVSKWWNTTFDTFLLSLCLLHTDVGFRLGGCPQVHGKTVSELIQVHRRPLSLFVCLIVVGPIRIYAILSVFLFSLHKSWLWNDMVLYVLWYCGLEIVSLKIFTSYIVKIIIIVDIRNS